MRKLAALIVSCVVAAMVGLPLVAGSAGAAPVTVTPTESPLSVGSGNQGRLMFRATLQRLRTDEMSGRVVVFARTSDFGGVMAGQPVRFTARITRPVRRDLTVAVLNATGRPTMGQAGALQRAAHTVRTRFAAAAREALPAEQAAMLPLGDLENHVLPVRLISARFLTSCVPR